MTQEISSLERRNPATVGIDKLDTSAMLKLLYKEDMAGVRAAAAAATQTAAVVDAAFARLALGGHIHYFGAGASGRLAMLDATEITPTFGVKPGLFSAHFPGGMAALVNSAIDLEDSELEGYGDAAAVGAASVAIGVTASGTTAYVAGALRRAREDGALTVLITCNPKSPLIELAEICIVADTGAEALTGSTRLKAGTATKVILNSFSTALMIRSGHTHSNLMIGLVATNAKLRERAILLLMEATAKSRGDCLKALTSADGELPAALVSLLTGSSAKAARRALAETASTRGAIAVLSGKET